MEQRCTIVNVYLNWVLYFGVLAFLLATGHYAAMALWAIGALLIQAAAIRLFPRISTAIGYGPIKDVPATGVAPAPVDVTLYTALGCPFCPIVQERLDALKPTMGFRLTTIDVTLRPDLLAAKKIKGVPVVEVGDTLRTGNLTSQELAEMIGGAARASDQGSPKRGQA
jgi:hypothetical protein